MAINAGQAVGYLDLDMNGFSSGLKTAASQLKGFTDSSNALGAKISSLGGTLKTVGSNMSTYVTLPLVGIGVASVATAADFEKSMSKVSALSGATGKDLEDLTNTAKEMGATTQFSASESADALGFMALAGWDAQQSMNALPGVLDLAAASGMGLAEASDMVTDYLSAFQEEADQAGRMADVLAYAQANSNTSTQQLGEAFKNCAVNANSFGLDIEQTTALLGKLADQGLKGSEAGTALNAVLRDMSSKMKDGAIAIGDATVKITHADGSFRNMGDIVADITKKTEKLSDSERMVALQSTFTADSIKAMGILMNTGADDIAQFTDDLYSAEGAAAKMAETMNDNLSGQLSNLGSALEGAAISIGEALLPVIKSLVEWINKAVNWFNNLDPAIQTTIVIIGGLLAAIGPVLLIIGQMVIAIGGLITFFSAGGAAAGIFTAAMAFISGPIGIAIAVIAGLVAVGVLLYKNWDTIKAKAIEVWEYVKTTITNAWDVVSTTTMNIWNSISGFLSGIWQGIWGFISPIVNFIGDLISTTWNFISNVTSSIWNSISSILSSVWELIKSIINLALTLIKTWITMHWNAVKTITTTVWNAVKTVINTVWNAIKPIVQAGANAVKTVVTTVFNAVKTFITTVWNAIKTVINTVWNGIKTVVQTGANAVKTVVTTVFGTLEAILTAPFRAAEKVISGILGGISKAINAVTSGIKKVTGMFKSVPGPQLPQEPNPDMYPPYDNDYSKTRFNYAKAKQTSISDVMASNYSMLDTFKDFTGNIKSDVRQLSASNENKISINLNIDKFVNERKQDVDDLMHEIAFIAKRKTILDK